MKKKLPSSTKVVVIGGGVVGCSVAYHLAGLIPIPSKSKQNLLEAFDASQRFAILSKYIDEISTN